MVKQYFIYLCADEDQSSSDGVLWLKWVHHKRIVVLLRLRLRLLVQSPAGSSHTATGNTDTGAPLVDTDPMLPLTKCLAA